ncbi:MAG: hydrolase 1, exosortase A system-associated [Ideonella sp.]|nr:hydrolase 1, exosortase A system-associated [Ideonella sp.]
MSELALTFDCEGSNLIGILHKPVKPLRRGIVIVVGGGPQYRAGGHRQLTLWSRKLCDSGHAVLRFDYRGMGDSQGEFQGFLGVDADIRSAIDVLVREAPELDEIVLWGECDAASAILLYAGRDPRVKGAVLLNPWVRTESLQAQTVLRHYYVERLLQPSLWKKVFSGQFNPMTSLKSALGLVRQAGSGSMPGGGVAGPAELTGEVIPRTLPLTDSLLLGLQRFNGRLMLVLSGRDLIAREFDALVAASPAWQKALAEHNTLRHDLPEGDHTFSSDALRSRVVDWGLAWLRQW